MRSVKYSCISSLPVILVWSQQPSNVMLIAKITFLIFRLGLSSMVFEHKTNNFEPRVIAT
jgi:hypothetical protein